ncbi:bacteriohemerythrin [Magnetospirillum sp. UT-4]|uniref:bacteriohemerythrin n=1 Tax=Magnetospirillum sp. UT-4 TaxID=2681467 RepID=UPI00137FCBAD|nr:bacteriohemerythrin [Magnetospirillum sp. UT-4]CAA7613241.1 hypothetical protein MTBUT4_130051 [Magnetospirillum sp. UT-4]
MPRQWTADLSVGNSEMDGQHRRLFDLALLLWRSAEDPAIDSQATIDAIIDYTYEHFANEERYLRSIGYPGLRDHQRNHGNIFVALDNIINRFADDERRVLVRELSEFVSEWLVRHILHEDMAYGRFVAERRRRTDAGAAGEVSGLERLRQLKSALDEGLITAEDYERRKQDVLERM